MSKYHNRKTVIDDIEFDSLAEGRRYEELKLLLVAGEISDLAVHPRYEIIPAFTDRDGKKHRARYYEADFHYQDCETGDWVTEDVKGFQTEAFKLKRDLFMLKRPDAHFRIIQA